jgi:hypothetical protein
LRGYLLGVKGGDGRMQCGGLHGCRLGGRGLYRYRQKVSTPRQIRGRANFLLRPYNTQFFSYYIDCMLKRLHLL